MKKVRVAVIGVGRMGGRHAHNLSKFVPGAELVAICDIDNDLLKKRCNLLKVKGYTDYIEMLKVENLDAVIIATQHYFHVKIAMDCMSYNVNVLVEKPISVTTKEASKLLDYAKDKDLICSMMFNQRTNKMYIKAKEIIDSKSIGEIIRAEYIITDWYRSQYYYNMGGWRASFKGEGGGTLINQCVHQLDIIQHLIGMPKAILAYGNTVNRNISTENDVLSIMYYDNYMCTFRASTHEVPGENRLTIVGTKGRIVVDKLKMTCIINEHDESYINEHAKRGYGNFKDKKKHTYHYNYGYFRLIKDLIFGQQKRILENFVKAVSDKNNKLIAPLEEGIKSLELINGMYLSMFENKKVDLPVDQDLYEAKLKEKIKEEN